MHAAEKPAKAASNVRGFYAQSSVEISKAWRSQAPCKFVVSNAGEALWSGHSSRTASLALQTISG